MYKLENDVEWTEDLKNAFKHNVTRAKIVYTDHGDQIILDENNGIKEIVLEDNRYVPEVGFIGQATAKKVTITLLDNEQTTNLENKEFSLHIGADYNNSTYYINYGNFIVNEPPENDSTNGTIKIVAYDYMIKFNKNYVDSITYPCTLKNYLINICNQAGVELGSQSFINDDFLVVNNQFGGKQLREILQHIGKCAFSWARIGQDNKLYFDFHANDVNAITENITIDDYKQDAYKKANEYYGPINKVTYGDSDIQGQEESVQDSAAIIQNGKKEIVINDNYFAYTTIKRHELIQQGTALFGLQYMPISQLDLIGFIYLDCNDLIQVFDEEQNSITSRVFSHTIKYNGAVSDSIETEGTSSNEENYKNKNTTSANNSRTEIMVDRANQRIESVIENVTEQDNKIATLTQTVDELSSKISDSIDITVRGESDIGIVTLEDINESEPITIKIHPISYNISYLYPNSSLYPSNTTYLKIRTIRFTNTRTNNNIDYELPDDLLYYDSDNYDEFYLDYDSQTCQITKSCGYNADGTVYVLSEKIINTYNYPTINLTDGDYTITILGYDAAYLFVRLMASNIYTTQFATKVELNSAITQTTQEIDLSVNQKLTSYPTTTEMTSAIQLSKDSIISSVSETYATKTTTDSLSSRIKQTAKSIELTTTDNNTSAGILIKLKNEDGTEIDSDAANITLSGLVKFTDLSTTGATIINGSNITTGTINANLITTGTLSADRLNGGTISGTSINLGNGKFTVTNEGALTATAGTIGGYSIVGDTDSNRRLKSNNGNVGMSSSTFAGDPAFWAGASDPWITSDWSDNTPFYVTNQGYLKAASGKIGGWDIFPNLLHHRIGIYSFEIRTDRASNEASLLVWDNQNDRYNWYVRSDGFMYARNADISGTITATSGVFENCTIKNTCSVPASTVSGTLSTSTIPNISAGKVTSGTMSGDRISGGSISASSLSAITVQGDAISVNSVYGHFGIGNYTGQTFDLIVNDGEKGWRRLRFRGGILSEVNSSW